LHLINVFFGASKFVEIRKKGSGCLPILTCKYSSIKL
jgi:hypothetical protein